MVTSDVRPEVEIQPFRPYAVHPAILIGTVRSLWTWLLIFCVTERADEASEGVDIMLLGDITARVSSLYLIIAHCHEFGKWWSKVESRCLIKM